MDDHYPPQGERWGTPPPQGGGRPHVTEGGPTPQPDARKLRGTIGWDIMMGLNGGLIGLTMLSTILAYVLFLVTGAPVSDLDLETAPIFLVFNILFILVVFGVIPFAWVAGTRVDPWIGALRYLGLVRPWPGIAHGLGYGALLAGSAVLVFWGVDLLGLEFEDTGGGNRFQGITVGLAIAVALVAGFAEEIFFRGILQKWVGVWAQAGLFGLMHLSNGWVAFVVTGGIGLLFGMLVKKGRSLWLVIVAHAFYNLLLLSGAIYSEQSHGAVSGLIGLLPGR